jgi:LCP family protein required for cell wall assembly
MQYVDLGVLPRKKGGSKKKRFFKWSALGVLTFLVLYASYLLYFPAAALLREIFKNPSSALSLVRNPEGNLKSDNGRTNFLLLGIDKRENVPYTYSIGGQQVAKNGFLTDSMMVVSIDQNTKAVATVSLPRDTWIQVPSWTGHSAFSAKINSVYSYGETENYPGGGEELARSVVGQITGVPIHYVVRIDFAGFKKAIDSLGGIDVEVETAFDDYNYPAYDKNVDCLKVACTKHVHFNKGRQHMDGEKALEFARSRQGTNGEGSDFARARRQQKVLVAAKDKALSAFNVFDPGKVNGLFSSFGETVATDVDLAALPKLYSFAKEAQTSSVKTLVLDTTEKGLLYHPSPANYGGAYVLLPRGNNWSKVQQAVKNIFAQSNSSSQ